VDGFDQDKDEGEGDEGGEVLRRLLAAQSDAFATLDFTDALLDCERKPCRNSRAALSKSHMMHSGISLSGYGR
jgi:hypothetical protein